MVRALSLVLLAVACAASVWAQAGAKGTVSGRVVDERGKSIAGAHVRAIAGSGDAVDATTDAKGAFQLELDPGEYRLEFEADGYASTSLREPVRVESGRQTKVRRKIELPAAEQGSVIRGSVFSEDGRSLPGAKVVIERVPGEGGEPVAAFKRESRSDRMGVFSFRVPKGESRYRITASREGFDARSLTVDASGGEILNVALRLPGSAGSK